MEDLNFVRLVGRVGREPEVKYGVGGNARCSFAIVTTDKYKSKSGEMVTAEAWHNIVLWGQVAEKCAPDIKKDGRIDVTGKIQTRKYTDKAGVEKTITEINASSAVVPDQTHQTPAPPVTADLPF